MLRIAENGNWLKLYVAEVVRIMRLCEAFEIMD